jgi:enoyl-CoA hydratase/carnithine racemase
MGYETLILEKTGAIATITMHRPDARNALDITMRQELLQALDEVEHDESARAGPHRCGRSLLRGRRRQGHA